MTEVNLSEEGDPWSAVSTPSAQDDEGAAEEPNMPIYVYRCDCGLRFERLAGLDTPAPECPGCADEMHKVPAGFSLGGQADAGLSRDHMPQTWRGVYHGDREYVTQVQRQWDRRQQLEAKYPELAGDTRPILAHEGRYHKAPLRVGDPGSTESYQGD